MENNILPEETPEKNKETIFTEEEFSTRAYDKHIRQARTAIFVAAAVLAVNLIILLVQFADYLEYLWIYCVIWAAFIVAFIVLGIWTKKKPYTAIVSALCLYGLFIILLAVIDPSTIISGIIFKIIIIVSLVKGLSDAKEAQAIKDQIGIK